MPIRKASRLEDTPKSREEIHCIRIAPKAYNIHFNIFRQGRKSVTVCGKFRQSIAYLKKGCYFKGKSKKDKSKKVKAGKEGMGL
jgi:hypothetical protein